MAYIWNPALETGHKKIDEQHKQLFDALNNIADAFNKGNSAEELLKIIGFLTEYTIVHFATEEELQIKYNYPGYKAHKQSHEDFKVTVGELTQRFLTEEPGKELVQDVTMTIGDWLISHIRVDDIRMAKFIKDNE